jgi:hypothetical protein
MEISNPVLKQERKRFLWLANMAALSIYSVVHWFSQKEAPLSSRENSVGIYYIVDLIEKAIRNLLVNK